MEKLESNVNCDSVIEEVNTFLFDMPFDYSIGHCVAKDMRMSSGIAVYFKFIFGRIGELMDQRPNIGNVAYLKQKNRFIYYLITKECSVDKPTYKNFTMAVEKLRDFVVIHCVKKLAIPRIGCGLDQLDWSIVKVIIGDIFKNVDCLIKVCQFTKDLNVEKLSLKIKHPIISKQFKNINDIEKREFEKLNFILFSYQTIPVYWDNYFDKVNEKHSFKLHYYKDYETNLKVGQCLYYNTTEAHIYVIIISEHVTDPFSYMNLEKGLSEITKLVKNIQWHPTFVIQKMEYDQIYKAMFERFISQKVESLIRSTFLILTPCVIIVV